MSRILNGVPPEDAARYRQAIQLGDIKLASVIKAPKAKKQPAVQVVEPRVYTEAGSVGFDIPLVWDRRFYNTSRGAWFIKEKHASDHRHAVFNAWRGIDAIRLEDVKSIDFVRLGPGELDDDNLRTAFKYVRDAVCGRLVWGTEVTAHIKVIGKADEILKKRGVTWTYAQQQYESNKKAHGARIRLHV